MNDIFKLSPSDFGFLYDECKRCFYLKVKHGFNRPRRSCPYFIKGDSIMKDHLKENHQKYLDTLPEVKSIWIQVVQSDLAITYCNNVYKRCTDTFWGSKTIPTRY